MIAQPLYKTDLLLNKMLIFTPTVAATEISSVSFLWAYFSTDKITHLSNVCFKKRSRGIFSHGLHLYAVAVVIPGGSPRLGCRLSFLILS